MVDVSGKPEITSSPADLELQFGATAVFHCSADGYPDPEIIWLHNKYSRNPLTACTYMAIDLRVGLQCLYFGHLHVCMN